MRVRSAFAQIAISAVLAISGYAQVAVTTAQYNNWRTAANMNETLLNIANVSPIGFGKLFSRAVDAEIYAHPLIVPNVSIPGKGSHNVVYVVSAANTVYAFDADDPAQSTPLWSRNLGPAVTFGDGSDVQPSWGALSTPVIYNNTMYLAAVIAGDLADWAIYMAALDITTGADKYGAPAQILFPKNGSMVQATPGTIQRAALLAANSQIYVAFANFDAYTDHNNQNGMVYAYSPTDITHPVSIFQTSKQKASCGTPGGGTEFIYRGGDVWQGGRGLAADAAGNIYLSTGNGSYDGVSNFGDTLLKLGSDLTLKDWFTPNNWQTLCQRDIDLGASGPVLIPRLNYVVAGGKEAVVYVLNQSRLGGLQLRSSSGPVTQIRVNNLASNSQSLLALAYWDRATNPMLFVWSLNDKLNAYTFDGNRLQATPTAVGTFTSAYVGGVSVSSNGSTPGTGIVWATTSATTTEGTPGPGALHAYDAANVAHELWNSDMNSSDALGVFTKFSIPVVANGKVYVITQSNQLQVYGLLPVTLAQRH